MSVRAVKTNAQVLSLWRHVSFLESLPEPLVLELANIAHSTHYDAGEFIFGEGERAVGIFLVESGRVKISRFARDGREHILHFIGPGDTFNDVAALDGGPNPATAIAFEDSHVWCVERGALQALVERRPPLAWALIESLARRARHLVSTVQDLAMRNVRGRLARMLLEQAESMERGDIPVALTQEEMASRLGTVREVVGRSLRALASEGIIEFQRNRIVVIDRARLEEEAEV